MIVATFSDFLTFSKARKSWFWNKERCDRTKNYEDQIECVWVSLWKFYFRSIGLVIIDIIKKNDKNPFKYVFLRVFEFQEFQIWIFLILRFCTQLCS